MTPQTKWFDRRWLIGFLFYLVCCGAAAGVVTYADLWASSTSILIVFLLGYLGGRISKGIEGA